MVWCCSSSCCSACCALSLAASARLAALSAARLQDLICIIHNKTHGHDYGHCCVQGRQTVVPDGGMDVACWSALSCGWLTVWHKSLPKPSYAHARTQLSADLNQEVSLVAAMLEGVFMVTRKCEMNNLRSRQRLTVVQCHVAGDGGAHTQHLPAPSIAGQVHTSR